MNACYIDTQLTELAHTLSAEQDREETMESLCDIVRDTHDVETIARAIAEAECAYMLLDAISRGDAEEIENGITMAIAEYMSRENAAA